MQNEQSAVHVAPNEMLAVKTEMTFGDGFRFGCGFMAAFVIFSIAFTVFSLILTGLAFLVAPGLSGLLPH
ncbi:MAG: hypothetical protein HZB53_17380 [Chloroflexi bacterium]|nr:hypothetical protein [Chloroflexota bacterium]